MRCVPLFLLLAALAPAQTDVRELLEKRALERVESIERSLDGVMGYAVIDLNTGRVLSHNDGDVFATASAIKVPVMIEVFRQARAGAFRLDQDIRLTRADLVDGSTRLAVMLRRGEATATVRELIEAMIEVSDNSAANKLIGMVGMERVNRTLDELGYPNTRLRRKMMDWTDTEHRENISTPLEMARIMEAIYRGKAGHEADCAEMLKIMKRVEAGLRNAAPSRIEVAAKPGEIPGARCETGIVFVPGRPFAIAVMTAFLADEQNPIPAVGSTFYTLFAKLAGANRYGHLNP
ncbi:MAG TPA: serine hydrolase [Bryobacteraceae bacterium]|nr:serine hydrolase [Bryobacteraceae bacterium]